jgi:hypothetical protein
MQKWTVVSVSLALCVAMASAAAPQAPPQTASIEGVWTLNKEASDAPPERSSSDERPRRGDGGGAGRGRGHGGGGGGGFGRGGGRGGGSGGGSGGGNQDDMRRRMQAVRDLMDAPDRLTITQTESLVIITAGDGRTTRLSPDRKTIKDESTGLARKTRWENGSLVSEITGGPDKMTETYVIDPEHHQLIVTVRIDNSRMPNGGVIRHVYDADRS